MEMYKVYYYASKLLEKERYQRKEKKNRRRKMSKGTGKGKELGVIFYRSFSCMKCIGSGLMWKRHCIQDR